MAKILHIMPYPIFPPVNGGMFRPLFFLRELARQHDVTTIIIGQTRAEAEQRSSPYAFPDQVELLTSEEAPPRSLFDRLPQRLGRSLQYRWLNRSPRGPASSVLLQCHHLVRRVLCRQRVDLVIFNHTYTMRAVAPFVARLSPHSVRVLSTHNVNSDLDRQIREGGRHAAENPAAQRSYRLELWTESHFNLFVDAFIANSDVDRLKLEQMNRNLVPGYAVPTGVDTSTLCFDLNAAKRESNRLLFCGTMSYAPNVTGLLWFVEKVWPLILAAIPGARLTVIGGGEPAPELVQRLGAEPTVEFLGGVDSTVPYYHRTAVAVVPLLQGSGTRVKIMEAMSLGSPVVSTSLGAEGIRLQASVHIEIADLPEAFAQAVTRLLRDAEHFETMRCQARLLVEREFDWRVVGGRLNSVVAEVLGRTGPAAGLGTAQA
jgi:glycosyltransferase involved in cell wall biosynthesis